MRKLTIKILFSATLLLAGFLLILQCNSTQNFSLHSVEPEMVFVEGGTFTMGCTDEQDGDCYYVKDTREATVSSFNIGKYPVTQAQWKAVMGKNPSKFKGDNLPVERVWPSQIEEYIAKLNLLTGKTYRLPTEYEWEYAARGGNKSKGYKYSGSDSVDSVVWYRDNSNGKTQPVGTKQPNELGIYDMSGNVWEWVSNCWNYRSYADNNQDSSFFENCWDLCRGGSWSFYDIATRIPSREVVLKHRSPSSDIGFRLACSVEKSEEKVNNGLELLKKQ